MYVSVNSLGFVYFSQCNQASWIFSTSITTICEHFSFFIEIQVAKKEFSSSESIYLGSPNAILQFEQFIT